MIPVNLTSEDFSNIHNGKCKLHFAIEQLEDVIAPRLLDELKEAVRLLSAGLEGAYEQEDRHDEVRDAAIEKASEGRGFITNWSMDNFDFAEKVAPTPKAIVYESVKVEVKGDTWMDMWEAADAAVRYSGDDHHIFIEDMKHIGDGVYQLSTGS